jgi:hypothetical protein
MGLTEISKTITALNRQNRIIVGQDRNEYNKVENNDERSLDNERTDLHDGGRLQPSESETSTAAGSDVGQSDALPGFISYAPMGTSISRC